MNDEIIQHELEEEKRRITGLGLYSIDDTPFRDESVIHDEQENLVIGAAVKKKSLNPIEFEPVHDLLAFMRRNNINYI